MITSLSLTRYLLAEHIFEIYAAQNFNEEFMSNDWKNLENNFIILLNISHHRSQLWCSISIVPPVISISISLSVSINLNSIWNRLALAGPGGASAPQFILNENVFLFQ